MKINNEVISPTGHKIKPDIHCQEFPDEPIAYYTACHGTEKLGQLRIEFAADHVFIKGMNNYSGDKLFSQRYHHVDKLLHEIAFRVSMQRGYQGRVEFLASDDSCPFHSQLGYINTDPDLQAQVEAELTAAKVAQRQGRAFRFSRGVNLTGRMQLPAEEIALKQKLFFTVLPLAQPARKVTIPAVVSHPMIQRVDYLVRDHQLCTKDAFELQTHLQHPSKPEDKTTWELILSTNGLKAMKLGYLSGWVVRSYFSQSNADKLKPLLSTHGIYAFSRQFIGWQDCLSLDANTLQFLLSDYGIKALEEGLFQASDFADRPVRETEFTEALYLQLKSKEKTVAALTQPHANRTILSKY